MGGLIGFILYAAANVYIFMNVYRIFKDAKGNRGRLGAVCCLAILLACWIPGLTLSSGAYSDLNLYFFFILGVLSSKSSQAEMHGVNSRGVVGAGI
jgi:hypothetical protein